MNILKVHSSNCQLYLLVTSFFGGTLITYTCTTNNELKCSSMSTYENTSIVLISWLIVMISTIDSTSSTCSLMHPVKCYDWLCFLMVTHQLPIYYQTHLITNFLLHNDMVIYGLSQKVLKHVRLSIQQPNIRLHNSHTYVA